MRESPAIAPLETIDHPLDVARPFIVIAAMFFSLGFSGYLTVHAFLAR